jgi:ion channel POLLUX/CASTOR
MAGGLQQAAQNINRMVLTGMVTLSRGQRPGTHADTVGTFGRIIAFATTIGGMLVFALMIGVVSDYIGSQLDDLKKGKSKVIESGHTLILGWSEKGFPILHQLALANESEGGLPIVVLSEHDKEEMEEKLRAAVSSKHNGLRLRGSRVVFRTGNPLAEHDLVRGTLLLEANPSMFAVGRLANKH